MATHPHKRTLVNFYPTQHDLGFFQGHQKERREGQACCDSTLMGALKASHPLAITYCLIIRPVNYVIG